MACANAYLDIWYRDWFENKLANPTKRSSPQVST
jgi:hypothetical protein